MRTKILMIISVALLSVTSGFAQSGETLKGDLNGDGKVDVADVITLIDIITNGTGTTPDQELTEDEIWNSNSSFAMFRAQCYYNCAKFVDSQIKLEKMRIDQATVHTISPSTGLVKETWKNAYQVIRIANTIIEHADNSTEEIKTIIAEVRAIRAFVYYNLAMLWGDVPLITTSSDIDFQCPTKTAKAEVFSFAYQELLTALNDLAETSKPSEEKQVMNKESGLMLLVELEMALGRTTNTQNMLSMIDKNKYSGELSTTTGVIEKPIILAFAILSDAGSPTGSYHPIYTYNHICLFEKELSGNIENIEMEWAGAPLINYGYWAALKRLGKAQAVTGCEDYELLMPFPISETHTNPYLQQNPGY